MKEWEKAQNGYLYEPMRIRKNIPFMKMVRRNDGTADGRPTAFYHLPGLFESYTFYGRFLPLYRRHREYFYDWCEIGSIYGAPVGLFENQLSEPLPGFFDQEGFNGF